MQPRWAVLEAIDSGSESDNENEDAAPGAGSDIGSDTENAGVQLVKHRSQLSQLAWRATITALTDLRHYEGTMSSHRGVLGPPA